MEGFYARTLPEVLAAFFSPSDVRMPTDQLIKDLQAVSVGVSELHFDFLTIEKASMMKAFTKAMCVFKDFTALRISGGYIAEDCFYYLAKGLRSLTAIERISILDDEFTPNKADYLCMAVEHMPKLTYLELSGRELSLPTCRVLCAELPKLTSLSTLNLNFTSLGYGQVDFCRALRFMPQLRNLFLFNVELGKKKGLKKLSKSFGAAAGLEKLDLSSNDLSKRWEFLSPSLSQLTSLLHLRLSNCNLRDLQMGLLAKALPTLQTLRELDLSNNELKFAAADLVSTNIAKLRNLALLNLEWNLINSARLSVLIMQLPLIPSLQSLGIQSRFFADDCFRTLLLVLPTLLKLETVFTVFESHQQPLVYRLETILECYYRARE